MPRSFVAPPGDGDGEAACRMSSVLDGDGEAVCRMASVLDGDGETGKGRQQHAETVRGAVYNKNYGLVLSRAARNS